VFHFRSDEGHSLLAVAIISCNPRPLKWGVLLSGVKTGVQFWASRFSTFAFPVRKFSVLAPAPDRGFFVPLADPNGYTPSHRASCVLRGLRHESRRLCATLPAGLLAACSPGWGQEERAKMRHGLSGKDLGHQVEV